MHCKMLLGLVIIQTSLLERQYRYGGTAAFCALTRHYILQLTKCKHAHWLDILVWFIVVMPKLVVIGLLCHLCAKFWSSLLYILQCICLYVAAETTKFRLRNDEIYVHSQTFSR